MKKTIFKGSGIAIVTPMHEDFSINYELFGELIDDQIARHTDALIVAGTTGEASTMTDDEHAEIIRFAVDRANKRVPVVAGVGSNDTAYAVWLSKEAQKAGADALLHVTPYYNKTSQRGLFAHFKSCAAATDLPVILYNVPSRTGLNIQPETCYKLCDVENIVAIKEASGNITQIARVAALCGDRLDLYSGNDDQITPVLSLGGKGVISVLSNVVPEVVHDICQSYFDGDTAKSTALQLQYLELADALFIDVNPIAVKQAMEYIGWKVGTCRAPLCPMDDGPAIALLNVLKKYQLVK